MVYKSEDCLVLKGQYTRKDGKEVTISATKNWLVLVEHESGNKFVYTMPIDDSKSQNYFAQLRFWFYLLLIISTNIFFIVGLYFLSEFNMDSIIKETYQPEHFNYHGVQIIKPDELFYTFYNLSLFLSNLNTMSLFFFILTSKFKHISLKQKYFKNFCNYIIHGNAIFLSITPYIVALLAYFVCLAMIMYMFFFGISTWVLLGLAILYTTITTIGFKIKINLMKKPLF